METIIFIEAKESQINRAFDATAENGYLLDIRSFEFDEDRNARPSKYFNSPISLWKCRIRHNEKAKFKEWETYTLDEAQKINYKALDKESKKWAETTEKSPISQILKEFKE